MDSRDAELVYADVFTLFLDRDVYGRSKLGYAGDTQITQGFMLMWAIIMETAVVTILLSRKPPYGANRGTNILIALLHTVSVDWSLPGGAQPF